MNTEAVDLITNSDAGDMPAKRLRTLADEETHNLGNLIYPPAARKQLEQNAIDRDRAWQKRIRTMSCQAATEEVKARGSLLLSIDNKGQLQGRVISEEDSLIREFTPAYLRRHSS